MSISHLLIDKNLPYDLKVRSIDTNTFIASTSEFDSLEVDTITAKTPGGNLQLSGDGAGFVLCNDDLDVNGAIRAVSLAPILTPADLLLAGSGGGQVHMTTDALVTGDLSATGNINTSAGEFQVNSVALKDVAEILTNKDLSSGTNTFPSSLATIASASGNATFSGIWAAPVVVPFAIERAGNLVTLRVDSMGAPAATVATTITSDSFIPAGFRPTSTFVVTLTKIIDNAVADVGQVFILNDGTMQLFPDIAGNNFAGAGASGTNVKIVLSWSTTA